ncbi:MAG: hypothetical protein LUM44_22270 [Pyrinomonadaceae bacterium]|nr:hypothetical protein [Pyrinomonadaceae bacterium]
MKNNFLCHLKNFTRLTFVFLLFSVFFTAKLDAQEVVDKTIVTVSDGVRTELITYSDLLWQIALQPNTPLAPPSSQDLKIALQVVINQRLFALEAERLPRATPSESEIDAKIKEVLAYFPSTAEFEKRLKIVGFSSVKDENFQRLMAQRVAIDKYLDFRFRSFAVITAEEENRYYREIFVPDFRKRFPGLLLPSLDEKRAEINQILMEDKVAGDIEDFLDDAKRRAVIVPLSEV